MNKEKLTTIDLFKMKSQRAKAGPANAHFGTVTSGLRTVGAAGESLVVQKDGITKYDFEPDFRYR